MYDTVIIGGGTLTAECNGFTKNVQVYLLEAAQ